MKGIVGILIIAGLYFSCSPNEKKDAAIFPEKKMREIMWDMVRADEFITDYAVKDSTYNKKAESWKLYQQIFMAHHVTADQFKKNLDYYGSRPDLMRPILDSLAKQQKSNYGQSHLILPDSTKPLPGKQPVK